MAQARGYLSKVALDFETTFGTDPGSPNGLSMPVNSFDVKSSRNLNTAQTIRGNRNPAEPFDGNVRVNGSAVVPVDAIAFGYWLKAMFGNPTTSGSGTYTHTFKVGDTQPSMVLEKAFATATPTYAKMNGCKVGKMSMQVGGDGELTANLDIEGAKETIGTTAYDATLTAVQLSRFNNFQAAIKEGGVALASCTDFSFDLDFGLDTEVYTIGGGGTRGDIPEGILAVSGTMTVLFENTALLTKAQNSTETSLELTFTAGANILKFTFPEVRLQMNTPGISGPTGIRLELPWVAYYGNDAGASAVKVELTNSQATY